MAVKLDEVLGAGGQLAALAPDAARPRKAALATGDTSRTMIGHIDDSRSRLTSGSRLTNAAALSSPIEPLALLAGPTQRSSRHAVSADDLQVIRTRLTQLTESDRQRGGGLTHLEGFGYLRGRVWPLLGGDIDASYREALFSVATEFTMRVAAMSLDSGHPRLSGRLLSVASGLAQETDDMGLQSWVMTRRAEQALYRKAPAQAVAYSGAAATMSQSATPTARAFILTKHALALSATGDRRSTQEALTAAHRCFERADGTVESEWVGIYSWGNLRHDEALCYAHLALGLKASETAEEAMRTHDRARLARPRAFSLGVQAIGYAQAEEIEQACSYGQELITLAGNLSSARVHARLRDVLATLTDHADLPAVRDLREAARPVLALAG